MNGTNNPQSPGAVKSGIDFNKIIDRAKSIITDPKGCWANINAEQTTISGIYKDYIFVLAAIPPIGALLGSVVTGTGVGSILIMQIVMYLVSLGMLWVVSWILNFLSPKFGGQSNQLNTFKLAGFAAVPGQIAGVFAVIPALGAIASFVAGIYSIYVFFQGITPMIGVPQDKRIGFIVTYIVLVILISIVIFPLIAIMTLGGAVASGGFAG